ncbi:unnamed protein product [Caenorhabditis auriculariae]|uniref:Uncharacterized protein n=1 Tax=Caenorhabditis auriculariae TaxID=2777116 RepID=A0A8S1HJH8_9PELO|nr:unnamed protein product [Caenorhabditis auriculariae]
MFTDTYGSKIPAAADRGEALQNANSLQTTACPSGFPPWVCPAQCLCHLNISCYVDFLIFLVFPFVVSPSFLPAPFLTSRYFLTIKLHMTSSVQNFKTLQWVPSGEWVLVISSLFSAVIFTLVAYHVIRRRRQRFLSFQEALDEASSPASTKRSTPPSTPQVAHLDVVVH